MVNYGAVSASLKQQRMLQEKEAKRQHKEHTQENSESYVVVSTENYVEPSPLTLEAWVAAGLLVGIPFILIAILIKKIWND